MKLLIMQIISISVTYTLLGPSILLSALSKHPRSMFFLYVKRPNSTSIQNWR